MNRISLGEREVLAQVRGSSTRDRPKWTSTIHVKDETTSLSESRHEFYTARRQSACSACLWPWTTLQPLQEDLLIELPLSLCIRGSWSRNSTRTCSTHRSTMLTDRSPTGPVHYTNEPFFPGVVEPFFSFSPSGISFVSIFDPLSVLCRYRFF